MKILTRILFLLICLPLQGFSLSTIVLSDSVEDFDLSGKYYEILVDSSTKLSVLDVSSSKFQKKFFQSEEDYNYIKNPKFAYWIRFSIKYQDLGNRKRVLELLSLHTEDVQFYVPQGNGKFLRSETGMKFPFSHRYYKLSNIVFDLPSELDGQVFYARFYSRQPVGFEFKIRSQNYFTGYAVSEYYFLGFYYGILFIMAVYNFLLFLNSKEKVYIFYVFYVLSCIINSFTEDGLGFQFIWSDFPSWNFFINNYLWAIFLLITFVLYSSSFLELRKYHPKFFKIIFGLEVLYFIVFGIEMIFSVELHSSDIYVLPFISIYVIAILNYIRGYRAARYFILGYTFVFISIIILLLRNHNLIDHNIFTVYSFNYGIVIEVVVLSFALGDRIKVMKEEKENAQKILIDQLEENQRLQVKVNRELEQKVNDRTKELQEKTVALSDANVKLQKLTDELNKFASKLDLDNWELNKKIVEETKARMLSRELSPEEFSKIYPNEFSCLKHLEEIKWDRGYKCKKCGNIKYAVKPKLLSRKCSKCNYIESVTSNTIFHGVKFPIHKAFYIAYITSVKNDKMTVDELADVLGLNRLTCWKFRKKVQEREHEIKKKNDLTKVDNWEMLLKED